MSLAKVVPVMVHGIIDYVVGVILLIAPFILGFSNETVPTVISMVIGALVIIVSLLTDYPLSAAKLIPVRIHSAADYLVGILLIILPLILYIGVTTALVLHLVLGIAAIVVSLITNYYGSVQQRPAIA
jgi:hypothetical protein